MSDLDAAPEGVRPRQRSSYFLLPIWLIWLPLLISPVLDLIRTQPGTLRLSVTVTAVVLFVCTYIWGCWRNVQGLSGATALLFQISIEKWLTLASLITLAFGLALLGRVNGSWLEPFIFVGAYVSGCLPPRKALPVTCLIVLLSLIAGRIIGLGWISILQTNVILIVTWVTTISLVRTFVATHELDVAREEIARLAVMNERLRIARDLHDLLGHNLSLIALKSELARRVLTTSPERAIAEISDVESVARTTLQEVREADSFYRQPTLLSELHGAQEILAAAGIAYRYEGTRRLIEALPSAIEAALGWTVREGVTNVIRHSRARQCTIRLASDELTVSVEVIDDGTDSSPSSLPSTDRLSDTTGNGLRGLRERVVALGGRFEAGACQGRGFRVAVSIPCIMRYDNLELSTPALHRTGSPEVRSQRR